MKWKHALGACALTSLMAIATVISAGLLGITQRFPLLLFDSGGIIEYDATTDLLSIEATPVSLRFTGATPPRFVNPTGVPSLPAGLFFDDPKNEGPPKNRRPPEKTKAPEASCGDFKTLATLNALTRQGK